MPSQNNDSSVPYAVVLTSCARFDLLRRTVESFLHFADVPPMQFIVVEDSGNERVRDVLAAIDYPFEVVINRPPLGQAAAIDVGYAKVKTPFIFHCEDDWLFFRSGFIRESYALLQQFPKISMVSLRGRDGVAQNRDMPYEEWDGVLFFRSNTTAYKTRGGINYNPGLRRLADYQRIAPVADIGGENMVSYVFKRLGFCEAYLEIPAAVHLGWGNTNYATPPQIFSSDYLKYRIKKLRNNLGNKAKRQIWRWQGLPKKWTDDGGGF